MNKYSAYLINELQIKYQINLQLLREAFMWQQEWEIPAWLKAIASTATRSDRCKNTNVLF